MLRGKPLVEVCLLSDNENLLGSKEADQGYYNVVESESRGSRLATPCDDTIVVVGLLPNNLIDVTRCSSAATHKP